ncbi:MAG: hypothetical protein ABI642_03010 [Polaromonas sp.]
MLAASILSITFQILTRKHEFIMYLVVIAWMYVVLMMSAAEAASSNGTVLGALVTLLLYGVGPVILVVYLMGAPARNKAIKKREAEARASHLASTGQVGVPATASAVEPDAGSHAPGGAEAVASDTGITPVRKEP